MSKSETPVRGRLPATSGRIAACIFAAACAFGGGASGGEPNGAAVEASFRREVRPILARHCLECHDGAEPEAGLRLGTAHDLLYGSASGRVVVPGAAAAGLLLKAVGPEGKPHMPPEGQLTADETAALVRFVDALSADALPPRSRPDSADHWAYQPLTNPQPPAVADEAWIRTPIDRFVLAKLEAAGLRPSPEAEPATLCRRLYFDLVGLPPSPEEVEAFVHAYTRSPPDSRRRTNGRNEESASQGVGEAAYAALVDKLLASPHYGERWGRHWLDLARYADSGGFHEDIDRPFAWRYRDYVIRSLNDDKPYAQFVSEQLAGDEAAPHDPQAWIATGFCRNGPSNDSNMGEGDAKERYRLDLLDDVVSTASSVFLGQTIGCARCHDHKFDPITQTDYYRLLAVFDNTKRTNMALDAEGRVVAAPTPPKGAKPDEIKNLPQASMMVLTDAGGKPRTTHLLWRGEVTNRGPAVEPGVPEAFRFAPLRLAEKGATSASTGRRTALAAWIGDAANPLTWRVVVNRIWQHHFSVGIVATPSNFGRTGAPPTHPELLDWLARQMAADGGRWKPLHRRIVLSAAYRQSSRGRADGGLESTKDPGDALLWRGRQRRLEAESLRDAVLAAAGTLNRSAGGPGVKPRLPADMLSASQRNKWPVVEREGPDVWRRSVYIYVKRQLPFPMLELFDAPATTHTCERRTESIVPTQALVLMNDEFMQEQAGHFAARLMSEAGPTAAARIDRGLKRAFGRGATTAELGEAEAFLTTQAQRHRASGCDESTAEREALVDFCHVLFNSNEFAFVD